MSTSADPHAPDVPHPARNQVIITWRFAYPEYEKARIWCRNVLKRREAEQEITSIYPTSPLLPSPRLFLGRFHHHWRHVHLRPGLFLTHERAAHLCLQTAPPLISAQPENDLDSLGCCICLHSTVMTLSVSIAESSEEGFFSCD